MTEAKVALEQAEAEFENFIEMMDLNVNTSKMDDEDLTTFNKTKDLIVREIMRGNMTFTDDGEPVYTPHRGGKYEGGPITFHEPTGAVIMMMDKKKAGQDVGKMFAIIAAMTKQNAVVFSQLAGTDYKVCTAIAALFLD